MTKVISESKVTIIGLGLIGGSIALSLRGLGCEVTAFDENKASLETGIKNGVIDLAALSIEDAVSDADLILVAVPVLAMEGVFSAISHKFNQEQVVISDVGSVKAVGVKALETVFGSVPDNFVLAHPIAGSEKHGVAASDVSLFEGHQVIITPLQNTNEDCINLVNSMWRNLGAVVTQMAVSHHDHILAQTSHLPHLLAFALVDTLSKQGDSLEVFDFAAGGLRDFSRIAASDPRMWRDIFESNREPILEILDEYLNELSDIKSWMENGKSDEIFALLERAKQARDHFSQILDKRSVPKK